MKGLPLVKKEQEPLYELLKIFSQFCEENNFHYFLVGGTLLGAVRHHGFIPWDDDIDVAMPEKDYKKFLAIQNKLPHEIKVQSEETDKQYPFLFAKLCNTSVPFKTNMPYGPKGVYIDIFPLIYSNSPSWKNKTCYQLLLIIGYILQVKNKWCRFVPYKNSIARFIFFLLSLFSQNQLKQLRKFLIDQIRSKHNDNKTLCSIGGVYKAEKEFYPEKWFSDFYEMLFEKHYFKVPAGWQEYLSRNYENYMQLPPINERRTRHNN